MYPDPPRHALRAAEGVRSNMRTVFEAVAHRNPYAAEQFAESAWNQMVLKALFVGSRLDLVVGLDRRRNEALARMLCDYAHERWAASRVVEPGAVALRRAIRDRPRARRFSSPAVPWHQCVSGRRPRSRCSSRRTPRRGKLLATELRARCGGPQRNDSLGNIGRRRGLRLDWEMPMLFIDPHIHMSARTTDDYERMAAAGSRRGHRACVLARAAADQRRHVRRLPVEPGRVGALPGLAVRHPPLLHDRPEQQGSQQRGARGAGDGRAAAVPRQGRRRGDR